MYVIKGKTSDWELVIGLETHIEVLSKSKLFSGASADYNPGVAPNVQVSMVDAAMPGMLPVLNRECVRQAIKMGFGLNADISKKSKFARKQYFYPDLPSGYQISQPAEEPPIVGRGFIEIVGEDSNPKKILIQRAHLEQDAGKNKHDAHPSKSFVDLNRSGVALLEIVTFLDVGGKEKNSYIQSPVEAERYLREVRSIARALGVSNANMEEGSMRADINISVRPVGEKVFRTRTEVKNMVSFKFIKAAIEFESRRQIEIYESGGRVSQDTMRFNQNDGTTSVMRSKEDALDYRYFPDPDLLPLIITDEEIESVRKTMPELPAARKKRYAATGLSAPDADRIGEDKELYELFDAVVGVPVVDAAGADGVGTAVASAAVAASAVPPVRAKMAANWILGDLSANPEYRMSAANLAELIDMIMSNDISGKIAKDIFAKMVAGESGSPREIADKHGLKQTTDRGEIEDAVDKVIAENVASVAEYKAGKVGLIGFFVGLVLKSTGGKANPKIVNEILLKKLG
ncbi:MAG: Asp-tRNA(Asn)/Glu-tRNA(Gln) amidotransferase subunit GatB [Rickettsiales bacterium]|jgi:aspartyl-tRNA(Asn)/glutamyl-tRNA(Gln) amidotransferase subunit B|nr:Asp-tRNA(Asn)/Glu-tRNA(Gln) amidotransferase subunit GatB [Rickettsiales bacterium]